MLYEHARFVRRRLDDEAMRRQDALLLEQRRGVRR
jgi:hypothetical protein